MKLGLFTVLFPELDLEELTDLADRLGIKAIELSARYGRGLKHFNPEVIMSSDVERRRFQDHLKRKQLSISQLNCSCNPISPVPGEAERCKAYFEQTFALAEKLNVSTVCSFSGCPGGGEKDETPNWITVSWPPEYEKMLQWQWEEKLIPFWKWAAKTAANYGVDKLAIEMHPGFCVYNPETLLKLRNSVGKAIGVNLDPSHLIWQGIHVPDAIYELKDLIWHVHAKDTYINQSFVRKNGVLDTKNYKCAMERAWTFRTVGYGTGDLIWKEIIFALNASGYDGVLSIEHEDIIYEKQEGLSRAACFLNRILANGNTNDTWWI